MFEIDRAGSRERVEFLADCVISAEQYGSSHKDQTASAAIIARLLDKLSDYLSSDADYLMLDEAIGQLIDAAMREGRGHPKPWTHETISRGDRCSGVHVTTSQSP